MGKAARSAAIAANRAESLGIGRKVEEVKLAAPAIADPWASEEPAKGEYQAIDVDLVDLDPGQPRRTYHPDKIATLAASIAARGQLQPSEVYPHPEIPGRYMLVFGHRRQIACRQAGVSTLLCKILDGKPALLEIRLRQIVENHLREDVDPLEEAVGFAEILNESKWSRAEFARQTGISQGQVAKSLSLLALPADVRDLVETGDLGPSAAYEVSRLGSIAEQVELAHRAVKLNLTRDAIAKEVSKRIESRPAPGQEAFDRPEPEVFETFAVSYPGSKPAYYHEATDIDRARGFARSQHPPGFEFDLVPFAPPKDIPSYRIIQISARGRRAEYQVQFFEAAATKHTLSANDRAELARARDYLERVRLGDDEPSWDRWSDFTVDLEDGHPVRVLHRGQSSGGAIEFRGPISNNGQEFVYLREVSPEMRRQGLAEWAEETARKAQAELHENLEDARRSWLKAPWSPNWRTGGAGGYDPIDTQRPESFPGKASEEDGMRQATFRGMGPNYDKATDRFIQDRRSHCLGWDQMGPDLEDLEPDEDPGFELEFFDPDHPAQSQWEAPRINISSGDAGGWDEVIRVLAKALDSARIVAELSRVPGGARIGDTVFCNFAGTVGRIAKVEGPFILVDRG